MGWLGAREGFAHERGIKSKENETLIFRAEDDSVIGSEELLQLSSRRE